jgi:biotin carboxylase
MRILMIGLNAGYRALISSRPDIELHVIEEQQIIDANPAAYAASWIREVRAGGYQQCDEAKKVAGAWHAEAGFDAVVPGMEYAVELAFQLARQWGLAEPGELAVRACTDKFALRVLAAAAGLPQPRFAAVTSAAQAREFFDGRPMILKPVNRRASVGVIRVDHPGQIDEAWRETVGASEGARVVDRELAWRFQAEDYIDGPEVSVESLVFGGRVIFENITGKQTTDGRYFTEVAHTVPAGLSAADSAGLLADVRRLLAAMDAVAGVFHSEWRISQDGPRLIECAARLPGDLIPALIARSRGVDLYDAFITVLAGQRPVLNPDPRGVAAVRFFRPPAGTFVRLDGQDALDRSPYVFDYEVNLRPGQRVPAFANSWQRAGYYALQCPDQAALEQEVKALERQLNFTVR